MTITIPTPHFYICKKCYVESPAHMRPVDAHTAAIAAGWRISLLEGIYLCADCSKKEGWTK